MFQQIYTDEYNDATSRHDDYSLDAAASSIPSQYDEQRPVYSRWAALGSSRDYPQLLTGQYPLWKDSDFILVPILLNFMPEVMI